MEYSSNNSNSEDLVELARGEEDVEDVLTKVEVKRVDIELNENEKEYLKKDQSEKSKKYPALSKLLAIICIIDSGIETILMLRAKGLNKDKDGKPLQKLIKETTEVGEDLRKIFRNCWGDAQTYSIQHLMKRFLEFSRHLESGGDVQLKTLLMILIILKQLTSFLINKLQNAPEEELKAYEKWLKDQGDLLDSILKSSAFRGIAVSAFSAGFFVISANLGLAALGFTAAGIQAGSIAAFWMSTIGKFSSRIRKSITTP
jgi:hypothetical protein